MLVYLDKTMEKAPSVIKTYGNEYCLARCALTCMCEECNQSKQGAITLTRFKSAEYLIRTILHNPSALRDPEMMDPCLRLLSFPVQKQLLTEVAALRRGEMRTRFKESGYTLKEVDGFIKTGPYLPPLHHHLCQSKTLRLKLQEKLLGHLIKTLTGMAKRTSMENDPLAERFNQVKHAMRLGEIEMEILLYAYLRKSETNVKLVHENLKTNFGSGERRDDTVPAQALAIIFGISREIIEAAISQEST
jgi:hypothetical protein